MQVWTPPVSRASRPVTAVGPLPARKRGRKLSRVRAERLASSPRSAWRQEGAAWGQPCVPACWQRRAQPRLPWAFRDHRPAARANRGTMHRAHSLPHRSPCAPSHTRARATKSPPPRRTSDAFPRRSCSAIHTPTRDPDWARISPRRYRTQQQAEPKKRLPVRQEVTEPRHPPTQYPRKEAPKIGHKTMRHHALPTQLVERTELVQGKIERTTVFSS